MQHKSSKGGKKAEVTIKDVAVLAGVSQATVGRVIGGYGRVSEDTIKKVMEAAKSLNYFPNAIAQSMKKKNTNTIGLIVANIRNPFFSTIVRGAEDIAVKYGYNVIICNTDEDVSREVSYVKTLYEKRVDGLIIATSTRSQIMADEELRSLYANGVPTVIVDREIEGLNLPTVTGDNFGGAYQAVNHLAKLGHKRIGVIGSPIITLSKRIAGYRQALMDNNLEVLDELIVDQRESNLDVHVGITSTEELLLDKRKNVTALLVLNNLLTIGSLLVIEKLGLRMPEDIALIGWDDFELAPILKTPLTVVNQATYQMATTAAEKLFRLINGEEAPGGENDVTVLKTELIIRESCGYRRMLNSQSREGI